MGNTPQHGWSRGFVAPAWAAGELGLGDAPGSTYAGGQALLAIAPFTGPAAPFVAAAGAATEFISSFLRPNLEKEEASAIVNEIDFDHMRPNLEAWNALQGYERTSQVQKAALAVFDTWWQVLVRACETASLRAAGVNCIEDRRRGGKIDWYRLFRDPIALDPHVAEADRLAAQDAAALLRSTGDTTGGGVPFSSSPAQSSGGNAYLYIGLGLVGVAGLLYAFGGDR